jgi:hypothetical protein
VSFLRLLGVVGLSAFFVGCGGDVEETSLGDPGTTLWARRFGRGNDVDPVGLVGVASGGVLVAGRHYGDVDYGGGTLPGPGNSHQAYVARYDGEGRHVYSRSFGDVFAEKANDVDALPDGSALVVGTFGWSFDMDGFSLTWEGSDDGFVAKLDPTGKVVWARALGGAGWQQATAVAAMPDGGAIVAGRTSGAMNLGIGAPEEASSGAFLVRLDAKGEPVWSRRLASDDVYVADIAVQGGRIAVAGEYSFTLNVGLAEALAPNGYHDGFVVAYDLEGKPVSGRTVGGEGYGDAVNSIAFTEGGGLVLTGSLEGNADLGGGLLVTAVEYDTNTYLLELDANLVHRRSVLYGGEGFDRGQALALSSDGSVILTGDMGGSMSFGAANLAATEDEYRGDAFVAKLDAARNPVFLRRFGGLDLQSGRRVALDGQGRVFIAGTAVGVVDFGLGATPASGYFETFVVALAP